MFQSAPLAVALVLLAGTVTVARAQATAREPRQRTVTVTGNPAEPPHEVHVSHETPTVFLFGSEIRKKSVRVDISRIRVVDTGEQSRSLIIQAVSPLVDGERHELEVEFTDGKAPARAAFVLVARASDVDTLINVSRQDPAAPVCPAEVRAAVRAPEDLLLLGYMDWRGVPTAKIPGDTDDAQGFESEEGVAYRGKGWLMFQVRIRNMRGSQPWAPTEATLTSKTGEKLRGRLVLEEQGGQGKPLRVLVVTEEPSPGAGLVFTLEVSGADGRSFAFPPVKVPAPAKESKP